MNTIQNAFLTGNSLINNLKTGGLNTLVGMGTVFLILTIIIILLSFFKIIPYLEAKKAGFQTKIESYKTRINEIDSKIQNINNHQRQKEIERILETIKNSGRSVDDFITSFLESAKSVKPGT
jgi:uncharacterized protein YoxC